jgi:hypothetical protein
VSPGGVRVTLRVGDLLARRRIALGFLAAAVTLGAAAPSWRTWAAGLAVAIVGEAVRLWAAGHLEKSREVTRSGPYRWMRHPLYAGSSLIALGVVVASNSILVAVVGALYMGATITVAVRREEAFLRRAFGESYDLSQRSDAEPMRRLFCIERAMRNREYRAVAGLAGGFALLALKVLLPI